MLISTSALVFVLLLMPAGFTLFAKWLRCSLLSLLRLCLLWLNKVYNKLCPRLYYRILLTSFYTRAALLLCPGQSA